jgi:hypothetical protein
MIGIHRLVEHYCRLEGQNPGVLPDSSFTKFRKKFCKQSFEGLG